MAAERFQTVMKKMALSTKNLEEGISREYGYVELLDELRLLNPGLFTCALDEHQSVSAQPPEYFARETICRVSMRKQVQPLLYTSFQYRAILGLWARECRKFRRLLLMHEAQVLHPNTITL